MRALVVGGTGPTGHFIVNGLLQRGYEVAMLHRGTHEVPENPPEVEHIHADPHFRETLDTALAGQSFDLVVATYGRIRHVAEALVGKTPRFISVGGVASYQGYSDPFANQPSGMAIPTPEDAPVVENEADVRFSYLIGMTEKAVMQHHQAGHFNATHFRYPYVYGPYQLVPREWCVVRRILDKRPHMILPDAGLTVGMRGYAGNLAHVVLLAVDQPETSAGQLYNCGDEQALSLRQWVEVIADTMDYEWELVGVPNEVSGPAQALMAFHGNTHHHMMDLYKVKSELGYRDPTPVKEALSSTVRWLLEHRPEPNGHVEQRLQASFDYEAEDRLIALHKESVKRMAEVPYEAPDPHHSYAHPKAPGLSTDHRER